NNMKLYSFLILAGVAISIAHCKISIKDCGSKCGKIDSIAVTDCNTSPCKLNKGETYTFNVTFTPNVAVNAAKSFVYGILDGLKVPFPISQPNACVDSNINCPMSKGTSYTYSAKLPIKSLYPDVKVVVEWNLEDTEKNESIFCLLTPVEIVG
uniref:NPC intracellular cholesterol transporter 2 n=2 Tax=Ciona intestinalis TaxID=7719 RepID=H2XMP3_CIOIN